MTPAVIAIIQFLVFLVCVGIGYAVGSRLRPPESPMLWVMLIAVVFVIGYLPILNNMVDMFGVPMQFNNLLWGLGIGIVLGLMLQRARRQPPTE